MPRKISEIREFTPKKSLTNIKDDPSQNSLMGNIKKLHDDLTSYQNNMEVRALRHHLNSIMDAHSGKEPEKLGDDTINALYSTLHTVYMTKVQNPNTKIADDKTRENVKNLIEYVAAGLGIEAEGIQITDRQRTEVKSMEGRGRIDTRTEIAEEKLEARRQEFAGKSALNVLDEHKANIGKLPKSFRGADAARNEAEARKQLKDLCLDIMATRRSIEAKRNDKSGLSKASINADTLDATRSDLAKSSAINKFLDSMSYSDLRKLASDGHGGAMEDKLSDYIKKMDKIPADTPQEYMPTAKERAEALQSMMNTQSFQKQTTMGEQRALYIELMAARAAVGSKRGDKSSLDVKIRPEALEQERKNFEKEPLNTALARITRMGTRQHFTSEIALKGHGGALEDRVRDEVRRMALEKDHGYKMQPVDMRYAPTFDERRQDLRELAGYAKAPAAAKLQAAVELGMLDRVQRDGYSGSARISAFDTINSQVDSVMKVYGRTMDAKDINAFTNEVLENGYESATSKYEYRHPGSIAAAKKFNELDEKLAANPSQEDLRRLAAEKMVLAEAFGTYQINRNIDATRNAAGAVLQNGEERIEADEKLFESISADKMNNKVNQLMKSEKFQEMCDKLGPGKLLEQAKGSGLDLIKSHSAAMDGTLKGQPKVEAVKKGPQNEIQNEGPQAGGPRA